MTIDRIHETERRGASVAEHRLPAGAGTGRIPLYSLAGVPDAEVSTHAFSTEDGLGLGLHRFLRAPCDDVVLLVHGLTTSTDMFIMPEHENLVRFLLRSGFTDVWSLDYRMSNRYPYNLLRHRYTLDDIALYDYPPALRLLRERSGARRVHVICHCLGAVSFLMSLFGGAATGVTSVIANSAGLTPRVPPWSHLKLRLAPFLLDLFGVPYIDPRAGERDGLSTGKLVARAVSLFHGECRVPACHMLSFMWGAGHPALYHHSNLDEVTHRRGGDLYGGTSVHYYRHMRKMVEAGRAVKFTPAEPRHAALPDDYLAGAAAIETPVLLVTGADNHIFADSNLVCHARLEELAPGRHGKRVFGGYGHQDVFMGKHCARDIFPEFVSFLKEHR